MYNCGTQYSTEQFW